MAISREKKGEVLSLLKDAIGKSKAVVFVNFKGLSVAAAGEMRQALRKAGVTYYVAKKTLIKLALGDSKIEGDQPELEGELAITYGDDLVAPGREINEFIKKFPANLKILGGIFDGKFKNQEEMTEIASIPSVPVLRGKFVNIINSPIQRFEVALSEVAKKKS